MKTFYIKASITLMAVVGASKAQLAGVVVVVFTDQHGDLDGDGVRLLNRHWDVLLDSHRVRPVDGHFDGVGHGLLYWVRDVLVDGIRLWHGHLYGDGVGPVYIDGVRPVDGNVDGNWHWLLNGVSDRDGLLHGVGSRYVYGVGPVNGHLDGDTNVFNHGVRLGNGNLNFNRVWHVFLHGVGLGHWHLDGVGHVFLNRVGLRDEDLHGVGPVDGNVDGVRYLLLNRVRRGHMDWDFDVLLHVNRHVFDDLVGLWYGHFHGVRHGSVHRVGDVFLDGHGVGDAFHEGDGPRGVGVGVLSDVVGSEAVVGVVIDKIVSSAECVAAADVADI